MRGQACLILLPCPYRLQKEDYLQRLEPLVQLLNERGSGPKFDRKGLAQLFSGLQQFMEDALGVNVSRSASRCPF